MAINYNPVGWDSTKFFNPTNMNQMDNGIKSACDGVDAIGSKFYNNAFGADKTCTISFNSYKTSAIIFANVSNSVPLFLVFSNGYLAKLSSPSGVTYNLSSDYKTITITNNASGNGQIGIIQAGDIPFTVTFN